jgi:methyl-accepting chemotaxis protein
LFAFRNLSLGTKLYGLAGVLLALLLLVGALSVKNLGAVNAKGGSMYADRVVPIRDLAQVKSLLGDIDSQMQRSITDPAGHDAQYAKVVEDDVKAIDRLVQTYEGTLLVEAEERGLERWQESWGDYQESFRALLGHSLKGDESAAIAEYFARGDDLYLATDTVIGELIAVNDKVAHELNDDIAATYSSSRTITVVVLLLALVLGGALAFVVARTIKQGVTVILERLRMLQDHCVAGLQQGLDAMSQGDLTIEVTPVTPPIENPSNDEIGRVAQAVNGIRERTVASVEAYNRMAAGLRDLIGQVSAGTSTVSSAAQQMASTSEEAGRAVSEIASAVSDVAQGAERQVRNVESARGLTEEVSQAAADSTHDATQAADAVARARELANAGAEAAQEATGAMEAVRGSSAQATEAIRELGARSDKIGGIVETITGIAEQTNLLALNAAIEAARAGEQGRGFAVVAEEVRKLAEESQAAAASIADLIGEIQHETGKVVNVVEDGAERTASGADTVRHAHESFVRLGEAVEDMSGRVERIAAAIGHVAQSSERMREDITEVAAVAEQSSASVEQVSASTEETSASAQEIAASAEELARTAAGLEQLVARFKVVAGD